MRLGFRLRHKGQALVEWLAVAPLLLVLGLGLLQLAFVLQARVALAHALHEAARAASTGHGSEPAFVAGLARGLMSFWRETDAGEAAARVLREHALGRIRWRRLGPDPRVFADFGEPARDTFGRVLAGTVEIPNDNLRWRAGQPGATSGLTLLEANRLSFEMTYAVSLDVPLAGPFFGRALATLLGCGGGGEWRVAMTRVAAGTVSAGRSDCPLIQGTTDGRWRWPVRLRTAITMHSPLRRAAASAAMPSDTAGPPVPVNPAGAESDERGARSRVPGPGEESGQIQGRPSRPAGPGGGVDGQGANNVGSESGSGGRPGRSSSGEWPASGGRPASGGSGGWPSSAPARHPADSLGASVLEQAGQCE